MHLHGPAACQCRVDSKTAQAGPVDAVRPRSTATPSLSLHGQTDVWRSRHTCSPRKVPPYRSAALISEPGSLRRCLCCSQEEDKSAGETHTSFIAGPVYAAFPHLQALNAPHPPSQSGHCMQVQLWHHSSRSTSIRAARGGRLSTGHQRPCCHRQQ